LKDQSNDGCPDQNKHKKKNDVLRLNQSARRMLTRGEELTNLERQEGGNQLSGGEGRKKNRKGLIYNKRYIGNQKAIRQGLWRE